MRNAVLLLPASLLLVACPQPVEAPISACSASAPSDITLVLGGRARIPLAPALAAELLEVDGDGITATLEGDAVLVRAGYETGSASVALHCEDGSAEVAVSIVALRMEPLRTWDHRAGEGPAGREYFAWWITPSEPDVLWLYGGFVYEPRQFTPSTEAWRLDLRTTSWTPLESVGIAPPPGGRVAPGPGGATLYFGGAEITADGSLDTPPVLARVEASADTMVFDDMPAAGAIGSYTGAMVHDAARGRWLSVCGADTRVLGLHCEVHAYTPETGFVALDVEGTYPPGRYGFHYALDAETDRVIVFGGQVGPNNEDLLGDTWALELAPDGDASRPRWVLLADDGEGAPGRRNGAYALDPEGHRLFVWGGTPDGRVSVPGLDVLSLDRGSEAWTHLDLPSEIPPRTSGAGVYDAARGRILFGFGNDDAIFTDLYALGVVAE